MPAFEPDPISSEFWSRLRTGKLHLQQCGGCGSHIYYPRPFCPDCMSDALTWVPVSGRGTVHAFTIVHRHWNPAFETPFVVAMVALDEGPVMTARIEDITPDPGTMKIGLPVAFCLSDDAEPLPAFRPA